MSQDLTEVMLGKAQEVDDSEVRELLEWGVRRVRELEAERDAWKRQAGHHTAIEVERLRGLLRETKRAVVYMCGDGAATWISLRNRIDAALAGGKP